MQSPSLTSRADSDQARSQALGKNITHVWLLFKAKVQIGFGVLCTMCGFGLFCIYTHRIHSAINGIKETDNTFTPSTFAGLVVATTASQTQSQPIDCSGFQKSNTIHLVIEAKVFKVQHPFLLPLFIKPSVPFKKIINIIYICSYLLPIQAMDQTKRWWLMLCKQRRPILILLLETSVWYLKKKKHTHSFVNLFFPLLKHNVSKSLRYYFKNSVVPGGWRATCPVCYSRVNYSVVRPPAKLKSKELEGQSHLWNKTVGGCTA